MVVYKVVMMRESLQEYLPLSVNHSGCLLTGSLAIQQVEDTSIALLEPIGFAG
jgi:hypothetical protein